MACAADALSVRLARTPPEGLQLVTGLYHRGREMSIGGWRLEVESRKVGGGVIIRCRGAINRAPTCHRLAIPCRGGSETRPPNPGYRPSVPRDAAPNPELSSASLNVLGSLAGIQTVLAFLFLSWYSHFAFPLQILTVVQALAIL